MATKAFQRGLAAVLLICICALLFCACGGAETPTTDPATGGAGAGSSTGQTGGGSDAEQLGGGVSVQGGQLSFALTSDGTSYEVTGIGSVTATDIVIPETYEGKPVTAIAANAFESNNSITSVTISDSVTSIGYEAFFGCLGLTSVTVGAGVTSISDLAFAECFRLAEVYNLSHLTVEPGSEDDHCLGYYAKVVHTTLSEPSILASTSDGYIFCYVNNTGYLVGYTGSETQLVLPSSFAYNGTTVTSYEINQAAFYENDQVTSVTIPNSVTIIGNYAFQNCSALTSVAIGNGVTTIGGSAFYRCTALNSVTIGNAVMNIGPWAFYKCEALTSLTIPSSVISIGSYAFSGCYKLVEIYDLGTLGITAMGSTSNGYVGYYAKMAHKSLSEPSILTTTADGYTFCYAYNRGYLVDYSGSETGLVLPSSFAYNGTTVTTYEINQFAFYGNDQLTSVTIPDSVTSIGDCAFYKCDKLVEVYNLSTLDIRVEDWGSNGNVGSYAKVVHTDLSEPSILASTSDGYIFCYVDSRGYLVGYTGSEKSMVLPSSFAYNGTSVTSYEINQYAFSGNDQVTSATIPNSVTSIGNYAFYGCTALTSVTIPDRVTSIGEFAFAGCTELTSVTIPDSVTSIGDRAFEDCSHLTAVYIGTTGWYEAEDSDSTSGTAVDLSNPATAATYLTDASSKCYFKRNA